MPKPFDTLDRSSGQTYYSTLAIDRTAVYDHHKVTSGDPSLAWELLGRPV